MSKLPNIIVITTHDSGRHFGCYGLPTVTSPAIDRLAAEGVLFEQMNAVSAICSPSRGGLLTGQYPLTNGLVGLAGGSWNWELHDSATHLSHRLRRQGFHTRMFGLQHETESIESLGFDDTSAHGGPNRAPHQRPAPVVARDVAGFLREYDGDQPFYAQVGFFETHTPYSFGDCQPDDAAGVWMPPYAKTHDWPGWAKLLNRFGSDPAFARQHLAELQGAIKQADQGVGIILDALDRAGLADDTLVLFNTDHGPELPGAKWTMYDRGLGIAFIMRWPSGGIGGGRRCPWLLSNVDFLPTLYELLGLAAPDDLQGISFAAACRADVADQPSPRQTTFGNWVDGLNFSARTERHKLIHNLVPLDSTGRKSPAYELYDLQLDPLELTDVHAEPAYAGILADMQARLHDWLAEQKDPTSFGTLPVQDHVQMIADYRRRYEISRGKEPASEGSRA